MVPIDASIDKESDDTHGFAHFERFHRENRDFVNLRSFDLAPWPSG